MQETTLEFSFKGNREYIQGPDMYNAILEQFKKNIVNRISFSVHGFVKSSCCKMIVMKESEQTKSLANYPVKCILEADGLQHHLFLTESNDNNDPPKRIPYDESRIIHRCEINGDKIELTGKSPFSFIETVVSMKKALLMNLYPDVSGKWVFAKIELGKATKKRDGIVVKLVRNLNFKIIKSNILHNNTFLGNIYFSLVVR